MKPTSVATTNTGTGKCISESWYANAKTAFNALSIEVRTLIATNFPDAFVRLSAWANNNGDQMNDYTIVSASKVNMLVQTNDSIYILLATLSAISFVGLFAFFKKKKHN